MIESLSSYQIHYMGHIKSMWQIHLSNNLVFTFPRLNFPTPRFQVVAFGDMLRWNGAAPAARPSQVPGTSSFVKCFAGRNPAFCLGKGWACSDDQNKEAAGKTGENEGHAEQWDREERVTVHPKFYLFINHYFRGGVFSLKNIWSDFYCSLLIGSNLQQWRV